MFTFNNKSKHLFKNMKAMILLGGNMGNRLAYLKFAQFHIQKDIGSIAKKSAIYETEAWGDKSTKAYLNQVIQVDTLLHPMDLLNALLLIEKKAGRTRKVKWGNRTLDLDILFVEDQLIQNEYLVVPHPEIQHRNFVLTPLVEIDADLRHPRLNKSVQELLQKCPDKLKVKKYNRNRV